MGKLKIGIVVDEILRAKWLQFDRFYAQEFGEDGEDVPDAYVYDFFNTYRWKDTVETIKELKEPDDMPDNINPVHYQVDEKGEAEADSFLFKKEEEIKLTAKEDTVVVKATNLEQSIIYTVTDVNIKEDGEICVNAKMLDRLFKGFRPGSVEIVSDADMIVKIKHGGQKLSLYGYDPDEFPNFPEFDEEKAFLIPGKQIAKQITNSVFAVSKEKTRFAIDGVLFELNDKTLTLVGTDGKRLSIAKSEVECDVSLPDNIIVPPNWLTLLSDLVTKNYEEFVKIHIADNRIMAMLGPVIMSSQLVAGVFPNYKAVIPETFSRKLIVNKSEFLFNLKQAEQFISDDSLGVKLDIYQDKILIKSRSAEKGEAEIAIDSEYTGGFELINAVDDDDDDETDDAAKEKRDFIEIAFNPIYIIDILRLYPKDDIVLEINDPDEPVRVMSEESFVYIVMPAEL